MLILSILFAVAARGHACLSALAPNHAPFFYRALNGSHETFMLASRPDVSLRSLPPHVREVLEIADRYTFEMPPFATNVRVGSETPLSDRISRDAWDVLKRRLGPIPDQDLNRLSFLLAHLLVVEPPSPARAFEPSIADLARGRGVEVEALEHVDVWARTTERLISPGHFEAALIGSKLPALDAASATRELEEMRSEQPRFYQTHVVDRNLAWLAKLEAAHERARRSLVVVSAHHLFGPNGLLALFASRGFAVSEELK